MALWFEKKSVSFILMILILIEIFYFSSLPGTVLGESKINSLIPITYHFTVFFLLTFFILALIKGNKKIKTSSLIFVLVISIIFSFLDEIHQIFVLFRDASFGDILTDSLGIFTSVLIYLYINKKSPELN